MEDKLHLELINFQQELSKLKSSVEYIEHAKISTKVARKIIEHIIKLKTDIDIYLDQIHKLLKILEEIDFPKRLDIITSQLEEINQNIIEIKKDIEYHSRDIKDEIKSSRKVILSELEKKFDNILFLLLKQKKDTIINRWIIIICSILILLGIIYLISS